MIHLELVFIYDGKFRLRFGFFAHACPIPTLFIKEAITFSIEWFVSVQKSVRHSYMGLLIVFH